MMGSKTLLNSSINDQTSFRSQNFRTELVKGIWGTNSLDLGLINGDEGSKLNFNAYLCYYREQCALIAPPDDRQHVTVKTHADLVQVIEQLRNGHSAPDLMAFLEGQWPLSTVEMRENTVNLAARLFSMARVGRTRHAISSQNSPRGSLRWTDGPFSDFLGRRFFGHGQKTPRLSCEGVQLPKTFDAWSLQMIGGIEVCPTDNLLDHLRLVEDVEVDDTLKVLIFHHASFLEYQCELSAFPPSFAKETLSTLALLFPQSEFSPGRRYRKNRKRGEFWKRLKGANPSISIDERVVLCGNLEPDERHIESFHFWRDRLVTLKQAYDHSTPKTVKQWWRDRRNRVQWYTFWVAILVLMVTSFLGVVQVVEGGLQVHKAFHPSEESA